MKKLVILVLGLVMAGALIIGAAGCTGNTDGTTNVTVGSQQTGIWVTGQGEVLVTPDIMNITLGITSQETTVAAAQTAAAGAMDKVMKALTDNGIASKDIQTQNYNITQLTRWDKDLNQSIPYAYQVSNMVIVKVRELTKSGAILDTVTAAGGDLTRVNSISFGVDDPTKYYAEVRHKAMNDANARADQLADLADVSLGKATYINESTYYPSDRTVYLESAKISAGAADSSVPTTSISSGEMKITMTVQVAYSIK